MLSTVCVVFLYCMCLCLTVVCDGGCWNGGECTAVNGEAKCICPSSWTGTRCQDGLLVFILLFTYYKTICVYWEWIQTCCEKWTHLAFSFCLLKVICVCEISWLVPSYIQWINGYVYGLYKIHYTYGIVYVQRYSVLRMYFSAAICPQGCRNGGSCVAPGICSCQEGWIGGACHTGGFFTDLA